MGYKECGRNVVEIIRQKLHSGPCISACLNSFNDDLETIPNKGNGYLRKRWFY